MDFRAEKRDRGSVTEFRANLDTFHDTYPDDRRREQDVAKRGSGPGWDGDQVAGLALFAVQRRYEDVELLGVGGIFAEIDDVDVDFLLLQLLG